MLVGGLFASLGMVAASFCRSIIQIYLTTGVITGESGLGDLQTICSSEHCWASWLDPFLPS